MRFAFLEFAIFLSFRSDSEKTGYLFVRIEKFGILKEGKWGTASAGLLRPRKLSDNILPQFSVVIWLYLGTLSGPEIYLGKAHFHALQWCTLCNFIYEKLKFWNDVFFRNCY